MRNIIFSNKLQSFTNLDHGFGSKRFVLESDQIIDLHQVHGNKIVAVKKIVERLSISADGLLTLCPDIILTIKTADCVPILFYESEKRIIGAVHAGWKGTLKNIVLEMTAVILAKGGSLRHLFCAIGPSIGACCYQVAKERARLFQKKINSNIIIREKSSLYFLDLKKTNELLLLKAGVKKENIEISKYCTFCHPNLFYSFRRSQELKRYMVNYITLKA